MKMTIALCVCAVAVVMLGADASAIPALRLQPADKISADTQMYKTMWYEVTAAPKEKLLDLAKTLGAKTFVDWVVKCNLTERYSDTNASYTLLVPSEDAFKKLNKTEIEKFEKNPVLMTQFIDYHSVNGSHLAKEFSNDKLFASLFKPNYLRSNRYPRPGKSTLMTVNGNVVSKNNQLAVNGVIHVVDSVIYPFPLQNIKDILSNQLDLPLHHFAALSNKAKLGLDVEGNFTVFAPSDTAIQPCMTYLNSLKKDVLKKVLGTHVATGTFYTAGFYNGLPMTSMSTTPIDIMTGFKPNEWRITNGKKVATIKEQIPYAVTNGVVYVVNDIILNCE